MRSLKATVVIRTYASMYEMEKGSKLEGDVRKVGMGIGKRWHLGIGWEMGSQTLFFLLSILSSYQQLKSIYLVTLPFHSLVPH